MTFASALFALVVSDLRPGEWANWAAVSVSLIGLAAILYQVHRQRQINSANLLVTLEKQYGEPQMLHWRKEFALAAKAHRGSDINALTGYQPVAAFFDMIAVLIRQGLLDPTLVWHRFGWRALRCWLVIATDDPPRDAAVPTPRSLLGRLRLTEKEPNLFDQFEWLGNHLLTKHKKHNELGLTLDAEVLAEMIEQYCNQESALVVSNRPA